MDNDYKHFELANQIIKAFYYVYNKLGFGFLENVYQNALCFELKKRGHKIETQKDIKVFYEKQVVGKYIADMVVDNSVILELKAVDQLVPEHENQLLNYLKATEIEVGLLLNFGEKPQVRRKVYNNTRKNLR